MTDYVPRAGSIGDQCVAYLEEHGGALTRRELADALGTRIQNMNRPLMMAVHGKALAMHGAGRGKTRFSMPGWVPSDADLAPDLPKPKRGTVGRAAAARKKAMQQEAKYAPAQRAPSVAALYSDGDVVLLDVVQGEDGTTAVLSEAQAREVHRFLERVYGPNE